MAVRPATLDDVQVVRDIARETWHAAYDDVVGAGAVDRQVDEWYAPDVVEEWVTREKGHYLVAEQDGTVLGYAAGGPSEDGPGDGVVTAIYVRPDHWGEGVGSALLETLHDRLRDDGCSSVWLAVIADNDVGRSFYEAHGYEVDRERTVEVGGVETRDLVLRRSL